MSVLLTGIAIGLGCWAARYPRRASVGIALGIVVVVLLILTASAGLAFLHYVLPMGQIDYWLTGLWRRNF